MWSLFRINVLNALKSMQFTEPDSFAEFIAKEYDSCIKRGGDMIYGVPVINGNVAGMADVIKKAFEKGVNNKDENFNILQEIYPSAFDAYWLGAEMAPIPNPILKPLGWVSTPPAPGTIKNIAPNPIPMAISAALHKAEVETFKKLEDELKKKTVNIPGIGEVNIYETLEKLEKREPLDSKVKNHPAVKAGREIRFKLKQAKNKKPSIGSQLKKALKFPFPTLPKKREIIEKAKNKLLEAAVEQLEQQLIVPIEEIVLAPIVSYVKTAVELADSIPSPKPTDEEIKKYVKDTINGAIPDIQLPDISIPKIPTKEEFRKMIEEKIPTKEELIGLAFDLIRDRIPEIPNIFFVPPTIKFTFATNIFVNPFVNVAKFHLMGTSGNMTVLAQYPPPAPPAPALLQWNGYSIKG